MSGTVYWVILFFFVTVATETLRLPVVTTWLSGVALYLPRIIFAVLIIVAGLVGGIVLRELVTAGAASARITHPAFLGNLTRYTVITMSILIAVNEVGVDITLLTDILTLVLAALLFGAAIGFALGAKETIASIIASYYVQKQYRVGQTVAIDGVEGEIVEITPTTVVLEARDGVVCVPARRFVETVSRKPGRGNRTPEGETEVEA